MMNATEPRTHALSLVFAWALVGIPLAWGVVQTISNALLLFR
jgi:hypothetical protein